MVRGLLGVALSLYDYRRIAIIRAWLLILASALIACCYPLAAIVAASGLPVICGLWMGCCGGCPCCSDVQPAQLTFVVSGVTNGGGFAFAHCTNCAAYNGTFGLDYLVAGDVTFCGTVGVCAWVYIDEATKINCDTPFCDIDGMSWAVSCLGGLAVDDQGGALWVADAKCAGTLGIGGPCQIISATGFSNINRIRAVSISGREPDCEAFEDEPFTGFDVPTVFCNFTAATYLLSA